LNYGNNVSDIATILQTAASVALIGGLLVFFRPLLVGIARALFLVVFPRVPRKPLAQRQLRDVEMLQRAINASHGPNDAAELRSLAARA
jgi:hypothetical protein